MKKRKKITYDTSGDFCRSGHYLYYVWGAIKRRCYDTKDQSYVNYGGRGISICEEWVSNYDNFFNWCISNGYSKGLTIDRIDNNAGYSPSNCRFVTRTMQQRNRRMNKLYEYNGELKTMKEWSAIFDISYNTLNYRISQKGLSVKEAVEEGIFDEKKDEIKESIKFGEYVKKQIKGSGRTYVWLISKLMELDIYMTTASLSNKVKGREYFKKEEMLGISVIIESINPSQNTETKLS